MADANILFAKFPQERGARYLVASVALLAGFVTGAAFSTLIGEFAIFPALLAAIAFSAFYCGARPAAAITILGALFARVWILRPVYGVGGLDRAHWVALGLFAGCAVLIIAVGEANRRSVLSLLDAQCELDERVQQRTAALNSANQSLRDVTARLMNSQDEERRRLARELHDSAGQTLAALAMNLATVRSEIDKMRKTAALVADSSEIVRQMSDDIRTMSYLLHPPLLDEAGLAFAVKWYGDGFAQRSKIQVEMNIPDDFGRLPQEQEIALFRVVQESLTNIHRHSDSPVARIALFRSATEVRVRIEDEGKGIPAGTQREMSGTGVPGVGIRGMRERMLQLGGNLDIASLGAGKGTRVMAQLPLMERTLPPESPAAFRVASSAN
jgi:signal transduction histidine kinase